MNCSHKSIVLIGMMGAGKSAVGRCLQQRTGFTRFDTDEMVISKFGIPISQIFSTHGENKFREAETEALQDIPRPTLNYRDRRRNHITRKKCRPFKAPWRSSMAGGRRRNALQSSFANWQSTIAAREKSEESVRRNIASAPATLCKDCRYPCRYIGAYRRRSRGRNFDQARRRLS